MANDEKKKPLVTLDAANPVEPTPTVQDLAKSDNQVGAGWGKDNDELPTLTQQQLENIQNAPDGVSMNDINKAPGTSTTPKLNQSTVNSGVLAGAPSQVVIQHMLDSGVQPRTKEEQEKLEKRRRRNALFAAIGDGISALSNLYFTTKGAPSADQSKSLSKAISDKAKIEDKEYETAMERRIRLLKEQWADHDRLERMRLAKELNDARVQWYGTQGKAKLQDANTNMTTKTIEANAKKEYLQGKGESEADLNKKKGKFYENKGQEAIDKGKAAKTTAGAAVTKAETDRVYKGTLAKNSTAKTNAYVSDKEDQKKKRKDGNAAPTKKKTNVKWQ